MDTAKASLSCVLLGHFNYLLNPDPSEDVPQLDNLNNVYLLSQSAF